MKRILYEAPVDDFMSQDAKEKILGDQNRKYQKAKEEASGSNLGELMNYLPNIESVAINRCKNEWSIIARIISYLLGSLLYSH